MRAEDESKRKKQERKGGELTVTSSEMWSVLETKAERALSKCWKSLNALEEFLEREAEAREISEEAK